MRRDCVGRIKKRSDGSSLEVTAHIHAKNDAECVKAAIRQRAVNTVERSQQIILQTTTGSSLEASQYLPAYSSLQVKVAPELFVQLFTIHALVDSRAMPMVYVLLQSKTQADYERVFRIIVEQQKHIGSGTVKHFVGLQKAILQACAASRRFSTRHHYWLLLLVSPRTISVAQDPKRRL